MEQVMEESVGATMSRCPLGEISEKREERNICTYSTYVYVKNERIMPFVTNRSKLY